MTEQVLRYQKITAYSAAFVAVTWALICAVLTVVFLLDFLRALDDEWERIRNSHIQQHEDEQAQFRRMIELLEVLAAKN